MLWGERTLAIEGNMTFEDSENGIKAVVLFGTKKTDEYIGKLYYVDNEKSSQKKEATKISEIKDIKTLICEVKGAWKDILQIGDKHYWTINDIQA
jgi:hypothetical protein